MAQQEQSFKIIEVCNVEPFHEPSKPSQSPTSLPLTFFDLLWLRFPPVQRLFFYELTNSTTFFYEILLPNLKNSLSLTLELFLPLSGNIIWPIDSSKPIINYVHGDSVSFTVVESKESFEDLSTNHCEASKRHHLIPLLKTSDEKASLISIQVTLFPNKGFCIGISTHHVAFDGKSSTNFMKSWSYITCSNPNLGNVTPCFDRSVVEDHYSGISEAYADALMNHYGPNNKSLKVWEFPGHIIKLETKKLMGKGGFLSALEGISERLEKVKNGVLDGAENWLHDMLNPKESFKLYSTAGSPRFEVYDIDFGFGKPKKVDMASTDKTGAFSLSESKNHNGGIEIGLALNKHEMEAFSTLFVQGLEAI
ncbi:phenolic glucoside malonyltransferase 1-like [Vicia villosa]|uniref:phenolic glucoside malonyltransferase 1-like n=1 Tax=Vicia villosa TaxID=3911 RepID=UPI00273B7480|nr:phenolic glucoside malonyltransferase 1-like [Vicia villosa]